MKFSAVLSIFFICCFSSFAQSLSETPDQVYQRMINATAVKNQNGEGMCWNARFEMDKYIQNYEITNDTKWLDAGVKFYDFLIGKMSTGPDGYKGWIGPYMYDNKYWIDSHVGDAILLGGMLDFSQLVLENKELKAKYQEKANEYVELAKHDLIEKNDKRGTWKEDGPIGGYIAYEKYMEPGNTKEWKYGKEVPKAGQSHPFNKDNDMGVVCLKLYRLTKDKFYRDRAEKIFLRMKRQMQYYDNHYEWNYWEPLGPWDIDGNKKNVTLWVGINPHAHYQAREVSQMVEAYHTGIVFDETDIKRIINTQLNIMWNKDKEHPGFINSNIAHQKINPLWEGKPIGTIWTALMDFDQTIRDLYGAIIKDKPENSTEYQYFHNVVLKSPTSFKRKYVKGPVKLPVVNFSECKDIRMAGVIPNTFKKGDKVWIIDYQWKPGDLEVALYSADGKKKIRDLFKGQRPADNIIPWDGTDPEKKIDFKGNYRIRWTLGEQYREFPISIN